MLNLNDYKTIKHLTCAIHFDPFQRRYQAEFANYVLEMEISIFQNQEQQQVAKVKPENDDLQQFLRDEQEEDDEKIFLEQEKERRYLALVSKERKCKKLTNLSSLDFLSNAIRIKPNFDIYYFYRSIAYYHRELFSDAAADASKALRLSGPLGYEDFLPMRILYYNKTGDYQLAVEDGNTLVTINPTQDSYFYTRSNSKWMAG